MSRSTGDRRGFWRKRATPTPPPSRTAVDDGVEACQQRRYGDAERLLVGALRRAEQGAAAAWEARARAILDAARR